MMDSYADVWANAWQAVVLLFMWTVPFRLLWNNVLTNWLVVTSFGFVYTQSVAVITLLMYGIR